MSHRLFPGPLFVLLFAGCFDVGVGPAVSVACAAGGDCLDGSFCLVAAGTCVAVDAPCVTFVGLEAFALVDGAPCGDGRICVAATCVVPRCGDGTLTGAETCEGTADCRADCTRCGDGVIDEGEECDDGFLNSDVTTTACRTSCVRASCGDGVLDAGEACDDGTLNSDEVADACRTTCGRATCGDTTIDIGEECDDGDDNSADDPDACRLTCAAASCGDGVVDTGESCDTGTQNSDVRAGACRTTCAESACGDGVRDPGEACDDGALNDDEGADACRSNCVRAGCGDGVIDAGEICDDDNANDGDGCRGDCLKVEACGDGAVDVGEECDDSNANPRDGCADCHGQVWSIEVSVSGSVEGRDPRAIPMAATGVDVDGFGRVFFVDRIHHLIRRVDPDQTVRTIAGTGEPGIAGDGGLAASAQLSGPSSVAVDAFGRVFIADTNNCRVRVIAEGRISTLAGTGVCTASGDDGPALNAGTVPLHIAVDANGQVFVTEKNLPVVRRIDANGRITKVAGGSALPALGDGGLATNANLATPQGIAVDAEGRLLIADLGHRRVRRVARDGTISTIAGNGSFLFNGDSGPATGAGLHLVLDVAVDPEGRVLIADQSQGRLRRIEFDQSITTYAALDSPTSVAVGASGLVFVATGGSLSVTEPRTVVRVDLDRSQSVVAQDTFGSGLGNGSLLSLAIQGTGDGVGLAFTLDDRAIISGAETFTVDATVLATFAEDGTMDIDVDTFGDVWFADTFSDAIVKRSALGAEQRFQGAFSFPTGVDVDENGVVFVVDSGTSRILRMEVDGSVSTQVGDFGELISPFDVIATADGLLISDDQRVLLARFDGSIDVVAGDGSRGFGGDGGLASQAQLFFPGRMARNAQGELFIVDRQNNRIRRVDGSGIIDTVAGNGNPTSSGDGGLAFDAGMHPTNVAIDADGRVVFLDADRLLRRIEADGTVVTVVGDVHPSGPGPTERARLYNPAALLSTPAAGLISVGIFGRVMRVDVANDVVDVVLGMANAAPSAAGQARFAPLLDDARGVTFDALTRTLVVTERGSTALRFIGLDPDGDGVVDDAAVWSSASVATEAIGAAGLVHEGSTDTFLVVDELAHCVKRIDRDGVPLETVLGRCGAGGVFPGFLNAPTHVAIAPTGAIYVADTGNHRVLRLDRGEVAVVIGDGSVSSAGEGSPARLFPVNAPRQLALDEFGNLFVASTTTVRLIANVDGDGDADGDDRVFTIFGGGARETFPESDAFCLRSVAVDSGGRVFAADACQGFLVSLDPGL